MDVYKLIEQVGAEIVSNRATARIDGAHVVVAEVVGSEFVLTEEGQALASTLKPAKTKPKKSAKRKRARNADGTLKSDDPSTPNVNEAWTHGDS